jgi:hypothetical protein
MSADMHLNILQRMLQNIHGRQKLLPQMPDGRLNEIRSMDKATLKLHKQVCYERIQRAASELCRSVLWFYEGHPQWQSAAEWRGDTSNKSLTDRLAPHVAVIIAWPMAMAVRANGLPDRYRPWLQRRLDEVADVTGASVLRFTIGWRRD